MTVLAVQWIHTWQAGAALHSVRFLSITQPADVEAQRLDIIDTLRHHQVLMHQVAAVRTRLGQEEGIVKALLNKFKQLLVWLKYKKQLDEHDGSIVLKHRVGGTLSNQWIIPKLLYLVKHFQSG